MPIELSPPAETRLFLRAAANIEAELHEIFARFAEEARAAFVHHLDDVGAALTEVNVQKTRFTVSVGFKEIDFCYSSAISRARGNAEVTVLMKPTHADYESPIKLGVISFDRSCQTNFVERADTVMLDQPVGVRSILMHFLEQARSIGFVSLEG